MAVCVKRKGFPKPLPKENKHLGSDNGSRADGIYAKRRVRLMNVDVLVLDDFGLVPLPTQAAEDLYEIIRERYERKSILLTSNRAPEE